MKIIKSKISTLAAFLLFPVFILGVFVSDFVWARLVKRDRKMSIFQLFETPGRSAQAGASASGECFPAGTLVAVAGMFNRYITKKIESLRAGDRVMSMDFPAGKLKRISVRQLMKYAPEYPLFEILLEDGMKITATAIHPFVINERNETRTAEKLRPGDPMLIVDKERSWKKIVEIKSFAYDKPVYNLELAGGPHNYFVSQNGLRFALVHNAKEDGGTTTTSDSTATSNCGVCDGCFHRGTLVATKISHGGEFISTSIERIRVGDEVLSVRFVNGMGEIVPRSAVKTSAHQKGDWPSVELETERGAKIAATDNHPLIVNEQNIGMPAGEIAIGTRLLVAASAPQWEKITSRKKFIDNAEVYNIELDSEPHNYLVSSDGKKFVLVHNADK